MISLLVHAARGLLVISWIITSNPQGYAKTCWRTAVFAAVMHILRSWYSGYRTGMIFKYTLCARRIRAG